MYGDYLVFSSQGTADSDADCVELARALIDVNDSGIQQRTYPDNYACYIARGKKIGLDKQ